MKSVVYFLCHIVVLSGCAIASPSLNDAHDSVTKQQVEPEVMLQDTTDVGGQDIASGTEPYPISLPALMMQEISGSDLQLEEILARNDVYTRYRISYLANDLRISGIMNIPVGTGPFPVLILNHGYIDPAVYTNGRGLKREQDYFARQGFAVVHPDYRNHAFSDQDETVNRDFRLGYTVDVIAAILAVQDSQLPELQAIATEKVGMLGHSMGDGITQNVLVVRPQLVSAAVLYAPVSSNAQENLEQYFLKNPIRQERVLEIYTQHGSPEENPEFWRNLSPALFFDRIEAPVQIHIGTQDDSTPPAWSAAILDQLHMAGKMAELFSYEAEQHEFIAQWSVFMERSSAFFSQQLH